jgi:hypothetical protein
MAISLSGSLEITGSIFASGGITGSFSGTATSASYATNADLLDNRDSTTFANTGSNSFVGQQNINGAVAITGSLTTTGTITAQTINVQQVTSSIVYSSGSNVFGNSVSNTQSMTGSVGVSGSLEVVGASTFINTINLNKATQPTAGVYIGSSSSTSSSSIFVKTASVNSSLSSGFGVNGIYSGGLSTIRLNAIGTQTAGGYASAMHFVLDNDGVERNHAIFSSDGSTTLYGALSGTSATFTGILTAGSSSSQTPASISTNSQANQPALTLYKNIFTGTGEDVFRIQSFTSGVVNVFTVKDSGITRIGSGGTSLGKFSVNDGTNINLSIKVGQTDATAVMLNAYNDDASANIPLEFRASRFAFQSGNVGIGTTSPGDKLTINNTADNTTFFALTVTGNNRLVLRTDASANALVRTGNNVDLRLGVNEDAIVIKNGGNVGIGTTSPATTLHVAGGIRFSSSGADANRWSVYWNGGTGDLIVVNNISDIRAKKDFDYDIKGLETIQKLKPLKFTWKDGTSHSTSVSGRVRQYGFIAQETMEADDYLAWYNKNQDTWGIEQYESFSAVMVKAIQEQQAQIQELSAKITQLENK